ncbi:MAG: hypothetical protein R3B09_07825 [Nannocystaceae bacterium]
MIARCRPLASRLSLLLVALATACGDSSATTSDTQASATASSTASTTAASEGSTSAGTGSESASDSTSTATSTATTAATTDATTASTTATSTTDATSTTTATTGESTSEGSTTATTTTTTTGGLDVEPSCTDDSECTILDSCCECDPHHVDFDVAVCDEDCDQSACNAAGLGSAKAICKAGRCTFEKVECNPLGILCKSLPPRCEPGFIPGVKDDGNGKCWSGACVPAEACDWAPECSACAAPDLTCVGHLQKGAYVVCEAKPFECGDGPATCGCAGAICEASPPWTVCHEVAEGIACECPNC